MAKLISKTYADALLEVAIEENKLEFYNEEVVGLLNIFRENQEFEKLLNNPRISPEEKEHILEDVFKGKISDEVMGFLETIVSKGRFSEIDSIFEYFIDEVKKMKGIGVAYVTTPYPLTDLQKIMVEDKLKETTKYQKMEMNYAVDESLIGGMVIRIGDRVVDSSVHTKIMRMQQNLMKTRL